MEQQQNPWMTQLLIELNDKQLYEKMIEPKPIWQRYEPVPSLNKLPRYTPNLVR